MAGTRRRSAHISRRIYIGVSYPRPATAGYIALKMTPSVKKAAKPSALESDDILAQLAAALKDADCKNTLTALQSDLKKVRGDATISRLNAC